MEITKSASDTFSGLYNFPSSDTVCRLSRLYGSGSHRIAYCSYCSQDIFPHLNSPKFNPEFPCSRCLAISRSHLSDIVLYLHWLYKTFGHKLTLMMQAYVPTQAIFKNCRRGVILIGISSCVLLSFRQKWKFIFPIQVLIF